LSTRSAAPIYWESALQRRVPLAETHLRTSRSVDAMGDSLAWNNRGRTHAGFEGKSECKSDCKSLS